jgi:hypothetical protein
MEELGLVPELENLPVWINLDLVSAVREEEMEDGQPILEIIVGGVTMPLTGITLTEFINDLNKSKE